MSFQRASKPMDVLPESNHWRTGGQGPDRKVHVARVLTAFSVKRCQSSSASRPLLASSAVYCVPTSVPRSMRPPRLKQKTTGRLWPGE